MSNMRPTAKFFSGQVPPDLPMFSQDNINWYNEQLDRCKNGFEFRGTRFTGDQWWFYNLCPMPILKLDANGKPTKEFGFNYPYWSQVDDYLFKQIEEADQANLGVPLMTHRGMGKTQIVLAIGGKIFFLKQAEDRLIHCLISASEDAHALPTHLKFSQLVKGVNKKHPSLELDLLKDNVEEIIAGATTYEMGKWKTESRAWMEKIVYGNSSDKTRGRRVDFQVYEEIGAWQDIEGARLKDCISASRGTLWLGDIKVGRDFLIGTGGNVLSDQAKEVMENPESFELYPVVDHANRKRGIVVLAYQKHHGLWEDTGFNDDAKAKESLEKVRAIKKQDKDPEVYNKYVQEYPFTWEEMFLKGSGNRFDMDKIAQRLTTYEMFPEKRQGEWGDLEWTRENGRITGVVWVPNNNGKMWLLEPPRINPDTGRPYKRLYCGGYDGIDVGIKEKVTNSGSSGSLCIKKRMLSANESNNVYVFWYVDKPKEIDDWFEGCLKACYFFGLDRALNIEDTKRGIVGYFKHNKNYNGSHFFMPRPRLTLGKVDADENTSNLIGTTSNPKNYEFGENMLITYIKDFYMNMHHQPSLVDLRDFIMSERTKHDPAVSMMMCELGDGELADQPVERRKDPAPPQEEYGYYRDSKGKLKWGKIPLKNAQQMRFAQEERLPDVIDRTKKTGK